MGAQAVRLSNVDIDNALKDKEFEVLFQPIFDLGNGALARVETFIRWRHPSLGVLPPGAFISFFESQGRMSELTRYVLEEALSAYEGWRGAHAPGFSINLALTDLSDESFASHFTVLLRERGFPAELITLECPMPAVDADMDTTARQLQRLADTGARLAIEVRGRANDFLKTIRPFPFAEIKTGGAAILRFARTVRGPGLSAISELLELAAEQNAAITAVGVEDQASLSALRGLGFAAAQGNHLAKVGTLDQFMPSHVNDVRALLGLEPLSSEDLVALFRTGGPALAVEAADVGAPAEPIEETAPIESAAPAEETEAEELAPEPAPEPVARKPKSAPRRDPATSDDELVARLSRRLAGAGAEKADAAAEDEADAKAAAIARAKRKILLKKKLAAKNALAAKAQARSDQAAPRDMQERLSREFGAFADESAPPPAEMNAAEPPDHSPDEFEDFSSDPALTASAAPEKTPEADPVGADAGADDAAIDAEFATDAVAATEAPKKKLFDARIAVTGARARFTPTIRVSTPEPIPPEEIIGDLGALDDEDHTDANTAAALFKQAPTTDEPEAAETTLEDAIPEPMSNAQWLEETVAVETRAAADTEEAPRAKKNFLSRKYDIMPKYSGYFWPRSMRKWMKRRQRRAETLAAE